MHHPTIHPTIHTATRRWTLGALLAAAALAGFLLLLRPVDPAAAQARATGWEYDVFLIDPADYNDKADYQAILQREGPRRAESEFLEHVLDHLGRDGWELVALERRAQTTLYLYLKRPAR